MKLQTAIRSTVAIVVLLFGLLVAGGSPATAAPSGPSQVAAASYADCPSGNVCFYTGNGGTGSMCRWSDADPDWSAGSVRCSWAQTQPARSVYNHGQSTAYTAVAFYIGRNYTSYNGCMGRGWMGDIGPVFLLSHRWYNGAC
ncbi:hypothetical protein Aph02nite_44980 [Actinoplanes philippinensis]|uniref:Peptidase inhibitor family I36 n=1 Tax=Actinoplanes philippinensis TaxID=35752 RepID=A0A1I2IB19_9ACTN|nr:peptidase inhibitor family I36 protein [Actinoplanes philippinensis]GIE78548.1 hypothetical protein Aph02nite_44980 [Actinoplanes philippinensis]SFF38046.1 Peptidase inhibitor family I36 [Actinoplanes philippinensis]